MRSFFAARETIGVLGAILWGLAAKFGPLIGLGIPLSIDVPLVGPVGPGMLLAPALLFIIGKTIESGATPFKVQPQPASGGGGLPIARTGIGLILVVILALSALLTTTPARADVGAQLDSLPAASLARLSGGILGGAVTHEGQPATTQGGFVKGGLSYNLGLLSIVGYVQAEPGIDPRYQAMVGARGTLAQVGENGETQIAVRVDYGKLWGGGYDAVEKERVNAGETWKRSTMKLGVDISHVILKSRGGRGILGVQVPVEYMPDNGERDVYLALAWQAFGGKR